MSSESDIRRAERKRQRELKDARKKELSEATSFSERRKIKAKYSEPKENSSEGRSEGNSYDSMSQREAAAGLYLAGNDTTAGRDSFYDSDIEPLATGSPLNQTLYPDGDGAAIGGGEIPNGYNEISATLCINGSPTSGTILFKASDS